MRAGALTLALLALALVAAPARAGVLAPEDSEELAQVLADAEQEQGICYGWAVTNNFSTEDDLGNSREGPGHHPLTGLCERYVFLGGSIEYACGSCEGSDTAFVAVESNLPNAPTVEQLARYGYDADDLTGDKDDVALFSLVSALPLAVAENGGAPAIPVETPSTPIAASDVATNSPSSDFWRQVWQGLLVCGLLIAVGVWLLLRKRTPERT